MEASEISPEFDGDDIGHIPGIGCEDLSSKEDQNLRDIGEPKVGMSFDSENEAHNYYVSYARVQGFGVITRTSKKREDGQRTNITYSCHRGGKPRTKALNPMKSRPTAKIGCKASINKSLQIDGKWMLTTVELKHNHEMCPIKARYLKFNRIIPPHAKRILEMNCPAGIRLNKTISSCVIEAGGPENMTWSEKDARNYMDQVRRSQLKEGDAEAMVTYFMKMQADNANFFYAMDLDEDLNACSFVGAFVGRNIWQEIHMAMHSRRVGKGNFLYFVRNFFGG